MPRVEYQLNTTIKGRKRGEEERINPEGEGYSDRALGVSEVSSIKKRPQH